MEAYKASQVLPLQYKLQTSMVKKSTEWNRKGQVCPSFHDLQNVQNLGLVAKACIVSEKKLISTNLRESLGLASQRTKELA